MVYIVEYGLDDRVEFDTLEQATIFTIGLSVKGVGFGLYSK